MVAAVWPVIAFLSLIQNLGLQQAVIQRKQTTERQLNQVFWLSALIGLGCATVVAASAPAVGVFYGDPRLTWITIAAGGPLFLGSLAALPLSILNRHLRFEQLAVNDVAGALASFVATVGAAFAGMGYWSLIVGMGASATVSLAAAWRASGWKPGMPDLRMDREMLSFGLNLTGFNLLNFLARNLDNILIGKFSGSIALGYYDRAYKLLLFPLQNINAPTARVMIPLLSKMQDDRPRVRETYLRTAGLLALVTIPGVAAMLLTSADSIRLLLGEKWLNVAPIFEWLGLAGLVQPLANTTGWLFISQGRTREMLRMGVVSCLVIVGSFVAGIPWGGVGVAAAYTIVTYVCLPFRWWYMSRTCPIRFGDCATLQLPYFFSTAIAFVATRYLFALESQPGIQRIATAVGLSYCLALAAIAATTRGRATIREAASIAQSVFGRMHVARVWSQPR